MNRFGGERTQRGTQVSEQGFGRGQERLVVERAFQAVLHRAANDGQAAGCAGATADGTQAASGCGEHGGEITEFAEQSPRGQAGLGGSERAKEIVQDGSVPFRPSRRRWRRVATISSISWG